jgi:hypothetical protein
VDASTEIDSRKLLARVALALLMVLWLAIRLPVLWLLVILEPVVRLVLSAFALLMTLTALLFEFIGRPSFPFLAFLALGIGAYAVLVVYEGLIQVLQALGGRRD